MAFVMYKSRGNCDLSSCGTKFGHRLCTILSVFVCVCVGMRACWCATFHSTLACIDIVIDLAVAIRCETKVIKFYLTKQHRYFCVWTCAPQHPSNFRIRCSFLKWWIVQQWYRMDFDHEETHALPLSYLSFCSYSSVGFASQVFASLFFHSPWFRFEWWFLFVSLLLVPIGIVPFIFIPIRFIMPHKCVSQLCFHRLFGESSHF